ncbi:hypothetical protein P4U43_06120 [Arthrobacter sp. EH-1B-1]|uniref:Galactan 5-O-arabinofuranosyltransferase n=1 Tax=Arthrobacter vasquezii TaxID=2977629 RepID=A0ABT6CTH4_9MICC|nr:hypothetical protein [Arthrobacter vasquezii]
MLLLARLDAFTATVLGPAVTLFLLAVSSVLVDAAQLPWNAYTAAGSVLLFWIVALVICRIWILPQYVGVLTSASRTVRAAVAGGVLTATALTSLALARGIGTADRVSQGWDPIFHSNVLQWIRDSGSATPWTIAPIYAEERTSYYPAGWHSFVSLYPGSLTEAANSSTIVIGAVVWPLGLALLASVVLPRVPATWAIAPVIGASFVSFPFAQLLRSGQWPNGLASALVPGVLAVVIQLLYRICSPDRNKRWSGDTAWLATVAVLALLGAVAAHPSSVFALLVAALPFAGSALLPSLIQGFRSRPSRTLVLVGVALLAAGGMAATLASSPLLHSVVSYPRAVRAVFPDSIWFALFDLPRFPVLSGPTIEELNLIVGLLMVSGAILSLLRKETRPLAMSLASFVLLHILAAGPENPLRWLTGVWYKDTQRIAPFIAMLGSICAAFGLVAGVSALVRGADRFVRNVSKRPMRDRTDFVTGLVLIGILISIYVTSSNFRSADRIAVSARNYITNPQTSLGVLSPGEQEFIEMAGSKLPKDAKIIGDPFNGAAAFYTLTGHEVVYTQLGSASGGIEEKKLLQARFNEIHTNDAVCDALQHVGATHFYEDAPGMSHGSSSLSAWPGFYDVPTDSGFRRVEAEGPWTLYEIVACRQ